MSLKRFRIEVEGTDEEDVTEQLDTCFAFIMQGLKNSARWQHVDWECTDEAIKPIEKNGQPLMYGRRVFKVMEKEEHVSAN